MKFLLQSFLLLISFCLIALWQISPLSEFTMQILGLLIVLFLLTSARKKWRNLQNQGDDGVLSIFILNTIIFMLVFATGGLQSNLFFLLYFLGFGVSFVFEPMIVFVFLFAAIGIFIPHAMQEDVAGNMIKLGSLVLIAPLAYFFGREYRKEEALKAKVTEQSQKIEKSADELLHAEAEKLDEKGVSKVNEILEETEDLRQKTKE